MSNQIAVLGAGAWGITIATLLGNKNYDVSLWEFDKERAKELNTWRSLTYFPSITVPKSVSITSDLQEACLNRQMLVFSVPSHTVRDVALKLTVLGIDLSSVTIVSAVKGLEADSLKTMSEVITEILPDAANNVVVLSGPTIAKEVAIKMPSAATAASKNLEAAKLVQETFTTDFFRVYTNSDIIGVEAGGALKNVLAIAAGMADGMGFGDNTKAALVTRGLKELIKLGEKLGGNPTTFYGLSGIGDLVVTCFSPNSRNRTLGERIARGKTPELAQQELKMVAEGVRTAKAAYDLGKKLNLELPIIEQVYNVLYKEKSPKDALRDLMLREAKPEMETVTSVMSNE
jgi:glycerol-3-phosphate dehydrogenase (NAD(P)+)